MNSKKQKKEGFKVPDGYFEKVEEYVLNKLIIKNEGYNIPENYFDDIPQKMMLKPSKPKQKKLIPWIASIAAIGLLLIAVGLWDSNEKTTNEEGLALAYLDYLSDQTDELSDDDLIDIYDDDLSFIDDELLIEYLEMEDISIENLEDLIY